MAAGRRRVRHRQGGRHHGQWLVPAQCASGGKVSTLSYNGRNYATSTKPAPGGAEATSAAPPAANKASAQSGPSRDAAIFRAAGFRQIRGRWESGCNDPSTGAVYDPGRIEQVKDLNGDGRPEALVIESGSYCYGNTGEAFWLVSQQANGTWKSIFNRIGIAELLTTKGVGGWPDISVGGPGFCFPVVRWNGSAYVDHRLQYEGKPCRRPAL
jgi:hypothetical protein